MNEFWYDFKDYAHFMVKYDSENYTSLCGDIDLITISDFQESSKSHCTVCSYLFSLRNKKPVTAKKCDRAWLSPDCEFYPCISHIDWAVEYVKSKYGKKKYYEIFNKYYRGNLNQDMRYYLRDIGWVELMWFANKKDRMYTIYHGKLDKSQKEAISKWYRTHKVYDYKIGD